MPDNGFWRDPNDPFGEKKRREDEGFWRQPEHHENKTDASLGRLLGLIAVLIGSLFTGNRIKKGKAGYWTWFVLGGLIALLLFIVRAC